MASLLDWRGGNFCLTAQTHSLRPGPSSSDKRNLNRNWKSIVLRNSRFQGQRDSSLSSFASNVFEFSSSRALPLKSTSGIVNFAIHSGRGGGLWQMRRGARWGIIPDREMTKSFGTKLAVEALFGCRNGTAEFHSRECAQDDSAKTTGIVHESDTGKRWWQEEQDRGVMVAGGRTLALVLLSVAWLLMLLAGKSPAAAAVEPSSSSGALVTTLRHHAEGLKPHAMQILAVFKEQGLLLTVLLGLSAFFSMAETSIMTLWPWKVRELADKEGEEGVFRLLSKDVTRFLTTILIGTTVVNIAATALVTDAATSLFGEAGVTAATGVMTVVILLVTEIAPKSIAVHNATKVARFAVRPVALLSVILYPVGRIVTAMSMTLLRLLGLKSTGATSVSEEELKLMLRGAELSGAIEEEEQDMIENVLEIKDTFVREVMTPLVDVVAIDAESTLMEFRDYWVKHQYSRTPVFERRVDNIVGIAYAMDMLSYIDYEGEQAKVLRRLTVGRIAHRPAYFVPDSMSVWNLLREFRIRKVHMAIVLNEYGGAVGVVTLEDVVEEIVGEIFDENDSKEEIRKKTGYVVQRADGVFDVDANTHVEDLEEALEVKMAEGPYRYETVSGFVCEAFGYIPRTGDSINVILKKSDSEDNQERADEDHQEGNRKEKFQEYKLEILAGNARKVGAVRFQVGKSHIKQDGAARNQGVLGRVRARAAESGEEKGDAMFESEDEFCDVEFMPPETVNVDEYEQPHPFKNGHLVTDSDDEGLEGSDLAGTYEVEIEKQGEMDSNGSQGPSGNGGVGKERPLEGRTQKRRGQFTASAENRQQRINSRRKQVEQALAAVKEWGDGQQKDPESETLEESKS